MRCGWGCSRSATRLPTVKEVAASLAINPNTVLKAYRELELGGWVEEGRASAPSSPGFRRERPLTPISAWLGASTAGSTRPGPPGLTISRSRGLSGPPWIVDDLVERPA